VWEKLCEVARRPLGSSPGQAMVEYVLVTSLVVLVAYAEIRLIGDSVVTYYERVLNFVVLPIP